MAQSVEHILGKDEVTSSILVTSSKVSARLQFPVNGHFGMQKFYRWRNKMKRKTLYFPVGVSIAGVLSAGACAWMTIRGLGGLLAGAGGILGADTAAMLGAIFGQLRDAAIVPGWMLAVCVFVPIGIGLYRKPRVTAWFLPLAWGIAYLTATLFSVVNDILFSDILVSLVGMAENGLFDAL